MGNPIGNLNRQAPLGTLASGGLVSVASRAPLGLLGVLAISGLLLVGCAKTSDVEEVQSTNRVQEERIRALEDSLSKTLTQQQRELEALRTANNAMQGQIRLMQERTESLGKEQGQITEDQERILSTGAKTNRRLNVEMEAFIKARNETNNALDKLRTEMTQIRAVLQSPIAGLPDSTPADKDYRKAHYFMVSGELDFAVDAFNAFLKAYPKDERGAMVRYRIGQSYFLLRRYDRALIAFYEVVEGAPDAKHADQARWMLARSLEETGDLKLAREFYAQLIKAKTSYTNDATRRLAFITKIYGPAK